MNWKEYTLKTDGDKIQYYYFVPILPKNHDINIKQY